MFSFFLHDLFVATCWVKVKLWELWCQETRLLSGGLCQIHTQVAKVVLAQSIISHLAIHHLLEIDLSPEGEQPRRQVILLSKILTTRSLNLWTAKTRKTRGSQRGQKRGQSRNLGVLGTQSMPFFGIFLVGGRIFLGVFGLDHWQILWPEDMIFFSLRQVLLAATLESSNVLSIGIYGMDYHKS